ncbi:hypothetical protein HD554DRAFT_2037137 [Boletus coccyginus]|nr:hypothetical protein HD554DRAFT_2037137 [Boletus coccyginus]
MPWLAQPPFILGKLLPHKPVLFGNTIMSIRLVSGLVNHTTVVDLNFSLSSLVCDTTSNIELKKTKGSRRLRIERSETDGNENIWKSEMNQPRPTPTLDVLTKLQSVGCVEWVEWVEWVSLQKNRKKLGFNWNRVLSQSGDLITNQNLYPGAENYLHFLSVCWLSHTHVLLEKWNKRAKADAYLGWVGWVKWIKWVRWSEWVECIGTIISVGYAQHTWSAQPRPILGKLLPHKPVLFGNISHTLDSVAVLPLYIMICDTTSNIELKKMKESRRLRIEKSEADGNGQWPKLGSYLLSKKLTGNGGESNKVVTGVSDGLVIVGHHWIS